MSSTSKRDKILLNPYRDWAKAQGIPIYEGFGLDLLALETSRWDFTETNGALVHLNGRGDYASVFLIDIPEAGKTRRMQHCFEEVIMSSKAMARPPCCCPTASRGHSNGVPRACSRYLSTVPTRFSTRAAVSG